MAGEIKLPPGFVLDQSPQPAAGDNIKLPPGFMLDAPGTPSAPQPSQTGMLEAFGRAAADTATFGVGTRWMDRERNQKAREEHPIASFAGDVAGFLPTMALGPAAAAARGSQAVSLTAKAGTAALSAAENLLLPNVAANTAVGAGLTAAKAGGAFGVLHGAGAGWAEGGDASDIATRAAKEGAIGTAGGAVLGPAFHGASKAVGAVANRMLPGLRDVQAIANAPEAQGLKDIIRHADYDNINYGELADRLNIKVPTGMRQDEARQIAGRIAAGEAPADIAQATGHHPSKIFDIADQERAIRAKYDNLNLIEAAKTGDLRAQSHTGELRPEVVTTRNTDQLARWAANTEGKGQNEAAHAFGARKDEMGSLVQRDIDQYFGAGSRLADAEAMDLRKAAIGKRYDKMRTTAPNIELTSMGGLENHPVMKKALNEAALNDLVRNPGQGMQKWMAADGTVATDGLQTLTPQNILDIHHALVMNARSAFTDPAEARMAGLLKGHFTAFVDGVYSKHKGLRQDFAQFKRIMEASEHGADFAALGRAVPPETMTFIGAAEKQAAPHIERIARMQAVYDAAQRSGATPAQLSGIKGQITRSKNAAQPHTELLDEVRKSFGAAVKDQIARSPEPNAVIRKLLTQDGKARILKILGQTDGREFISALYNKRTQQDLGNKLYGGSDTAFKLQKNETMDALGKTAMGVLHLRPTAVMQGLGELASSGFRTRRADAVNDVMSRQGVDELRRMLDAIVAKQSLKATADPYVRNPLLMSVPAITGQPVRGMTAPPSEFRR